jgi:hypothetical protein
VEHNDKMWFETYQRCPFGEVVFMLPATEEHQSLPLISQAGFFRERLLVVEKAARDLQLRLDRSLQSFCCRMVGSTAAPELVCDWLLERVTGVSQRAIGSYVAKILSVSVLLVPIICAINSEPRM